MNRRNFMAACAAAIVGGKPKTNHAPACVVFSSPNRLPDEEVRRIYKQIAAQHSDNFQRLHRTLRNYAPIGMVSLTK